MSKRFPWIHSRKRSAPDLPVETPLWLGNQSNGEYFRTAKPRERLLHRAILEKADENARRLGMDRRDFLASSMGMCTTLWMMNHVAGCSSSDGSSGNGSSDGGGGSGGGGRDGGSGGGGRDGGSGGASADADAKLCVPDESMLDEDVACQTIGGDEFIFDVQTHWFNRDDLATFPLYLQLFGPLIDRADETYYIEKMFCDSDTSMAVLTSWPSVTCVGTTSTNCGLPLSNESMIESRLHINELARNTQRLVNHAQIMVQDPQGVDYQLAIMEAACGNGTAQGFKLYPGFKPPFTLDDPKGRAVIEKGIELGRPIFAIHKGLPIGAFFDVDVGNHPREVGVVARDYKEATFIIYHSGICTGFDDCDNAPPEGPYNPDDPNPVGTNALIRSLLDNGVEPNSNVYAEVGSALNQVQRDTTAAAHFFGKLLKYVGVDRVVWGTDCVIYGTPQTFIEWFRTLTIPQSMQETYGYPALDAATKAKIFGLNAARAYKVDVAKKRCELDYQCPVTARRQIMDGELGGRRWAFQRPGGPRTRAEYLAHVARCEREGHPG